MACYIPPVDHGLEIIYQDDYLLAVNKPAGLLSVPGRGEDKQDCLLSRVRQEFPAALTVHRLDMGTSGLMILALGKAMERALSILFQQRQVEKRYEAVVSGVLHPAEGAIDLPLITDWPNRPRQKVDHDLGKPSYTRYRLLAADPGNHCSRVTLELLTGRSHQLRVHLMSIGHAILGDELYAAEADYQRADRLLLHACQLSLIHPVTGVVLNLNSPVPF